MPLLQTHNLTKKFESLKAVNELAVSFEEGKITGVIGPNGSGKSTLINLLTGMIPFDGGVIMVTGKAPLRKILSKNVPSLGMTRTFQEVRLFEQMTVLDNILVVISKRTWFAALLEGQKNSHLAIAQKVLERVGIWQFRDKNAVSLSYGQRKLLEIARVLAMKETSLAHIFFFDEPFAGLFPEMVKVVVSVMKELCEQGSTIVLVEHNMDLIRELSDTVIVMDAGELLAEGVPGEVLATKEVIEAYLGE